MKENKFRTPVICHNGHKALWYWHIDELGIGDIKHEGVISNCCNCSKQALGDGYKRNGNDQQYIGLKDKGNKDIYEGDILRCKCRKYSKFLEDTAPLEFYRNSVVEWWQSNVKLEYRLRDGKGKTITFKPSHVSAMQIEVIGNLYENPELLNSENKDK